jgi:hypothetical protein
MKSEIRYITATHEFDNQRASEKKYKDRQEAELFSYIANSMHWGLELMPIQMSIDEKLGTIEAKLILISDERLEELLKYERHMKNRGFSYKGRLFKEMLDRFERGQT